MLTFGDKWQSLLYVGDKAKPPWVGRAGHRSPSAQTPRSPRGQRVFLRVAVSIRSNKLSGGGEHRGGVSPLSCPSWWGLRYSSTVLLSLGGGGLCWVVLSLPHTQEGLGSLGPWVPEGAVFCGIWPIFSPEIDFFLSFLFFYFFLPSFPRPSFLPFSLPSFLS